MTITRPKTRTFLPRTPIWFPKSGLCLFVLRRVVTPLCFSTPMGLALYGITDAEHRQLLNEQEFKCACCRTRPPQVIDHAHAQYSGPCGAHKVRGIVCRSCNARIGVYEAGGKLGNVRGSTADIRRYLGRPNPLGYIKNPARSTE